MGFLSGPVSFDCYRIDPSEVRQFGNEQIEILEQFAIGQIETSSIDQPSTGFLAGEHLFDLDFSLEKNVIGDALHWAMRIDTNQIPAAIRKAWLQMELAALMAESSEGRPTKAQRQEAKQAVAARCEEEARGGKFRRMQQFPLLWNANDGILYFGGASSTAGELCCDLCCQAFEFELGRLTAGRRALQWAAEAKRRKALDDAMPSAFHPGEGGTDIAWWNGESGNFDFLGNEFLLWLWWYWETQSDTIGLPDGSEVTGMFARTLSLQCPRNESGKETITAELPVCLPEAAQAIRSGKLPRKAGLILCRQKQQYELVLQAETFAVSGAKISTDETAESEDGRGILESRIERVCELQETVDLLFRAFCERRIGKEWSGKLSEMRRWLKSPGAGKRRQSAGA